MSEEEIIKMLQEIIQKNQQVVKEAYKNKDINTMQLVADIDNEAIAIQGLLDLYNKEKEKNKSIEAQRLRDMCYKTDGNYISKDKIKDEVEYIRFMVDDDNKSSEIVKEVNLYLDLFLQELLEERN